MALIACPECNNQVSSKAATCPQCGVRIKAPLISKEFQIVLGILITFFLCLFLYGSQMDKIKSQHEAADAALRATEALKNVNKKK